MNKIREKSNFLPQSLKCQYVHGCNALGMCVCMLSCAQFDSVVTRRCIRCMTVFAVLCVLGEVYM